MATEPTFEDLRQISEYVYPVANDNPDDHNEPGRVPLPEDYENISDKPADPLDPNGPTRKEAETQRLH